MSTDDLVAIEHALLGLPDGARVLVQACASESDLLAETVIRLGRRLKNLTFTGIFVPALNENTYLAHDGCRVETFFMTPELKAAADRVEFLPLCYEDIARRLAAIRIDAALMMVSEADSAGECSFGPTHDFLADLWPRIPVRVAHINPSLPFVRGYTIPRSALTALVTCAVPLKVMEEGRADAVSARIAAHVADFIQDNCTLQVGLGRLPGAVLDALQNRKNLRVHSGLMGDGVLRLLQAGAIAKNGATCGCAIGGAELYEGLNHPDLSFAPVSVTHGVGTLDQLQNFVAINSALEIDLFGQAYAERIPNGWISGPGGASDYARVARRNGGVFILALPSTTGRSNISRIIAPHQAKGPVSLGRNDVGVVVTEHGAADLRGLGLRAKAEALIAVAAPEHRHDLSIAFAEFQI